MARRTCTLALTECVSKPGYLPQTRLRELEAAIQLHVNLAEFKKFSHFLRTMTEQVHYN
jgi:hypothetical protein